MSGLILGELTVADIGRRARHGLTLATPPFITRIESSIGALHRSIHELYAAYDVLENDITPDFVVRVNGTGGVRRWVRRQCMADIDMQTPFIPLPESMSILMLEQALNWSVAMREANHLIFHAAVVEKDGKAILIPGESGQGKSTLCASLVANGWRQFSDELAMVDIESRQMVPYPRPISLKNKSIEAMRDAAPHRIFSPTFRDTPKGDVAYMAADREALVSAHRHAPLHAIIVPAYDPDFTPALEPMDKAKSFLFMSSCSINFSGFGELGFDLLRFLVEEHPTVMAKYCDVESGQRLADEVLSL